MPEYLIRLDDACETMFHEKWNRMFALLEEHSVKPLVGIIPANEDPEQQCKAANNNFWAQMRAGSKAGWELCMHGFNHVYTTDNAGLHPVNKYSEFAGVPYEIQAQKIADSVRVFRENEIEPRVFFAPAHTFDENTLKALQTESRIRIISDTVALKPYVSKDFLFVPQQMGTCRAVPFGMLTFCYHPNSMTENDFLELEKFLVVHSSKFTSLASVISREQYGRKAIADKLLTKMYFAARAVRSFFK